MTKFKTITAKTLPPTTTLPFNKGYHSDNILNQLVKKNGLGKQLNASNCTEYCTIKNEILI